MEVLSCNVLEFVERDAGIPGRRGAQKYYRKVVLVVLVPTRVEGTVYLFIIFLLYTSFLQHHHNPVLPKSIVLRQQKFYVLRFTMLWPSFFDKMVCQRLPDAPIS